FAPRLKCKTPRAERVATTDLFHDVGRGARAAAGSFYMLGGTREVIKAAVAKVRDLYPRLAIAGYRHGYCRRDGDEARIIAEIDAARPDLLWIGMGAPLELAFSLRN